MLRGIINKLIIFGLFSFSICLYSQSNTISVLVKKSERKLYILENGKILKSYKIALGRNPEGAKKQEGDCKTPEGQYLLDYKKADSSYYKAIHISYPNKEDISNARKNNYDPGGLIMIHGQKNGFGWLGSIVQKFDWTRGCIALTNKDMDELWKLVKVKPPITITK